MPNECTHPIPSREGSPWAFKCWECQKVIVDESHKPIETMPNEYIKKSDIMKLLDGFVECDIIGSLPEDINSLPTINPEGVLEEMIKELKFLGSDYTENPIILLKEAQVRIRNQS